MNEHVDYSAKPATGATRFLWWCAGADKDILKYSSYADHVKYVGIGGIVLATGILASLSMFFAINYIFENAAIAIPVGLLWGAIIFNLDRFIVSSTGKGDGTDTITWKELGNATPRLAMAMILGFTISAPLEVYIFQKEIDKQFYKLDQEEQKAEIKKIEDIYTKSPEFNKLNKDKATIEEEVKNLEKEREDYQKRAAKENATEFGGCGPKCEEFKRMASEVMGRIEERKAKINALDKKLQVYEDEKTAKIKELSSVNNSSHGLLDRLLALHAIPGSSVPAWMIRLMFVFIEIAPVLLKLMLIKSPYDYMSENVNQILETKQGINREHIIDENNKLHTMKGFYNPKRIIAIVEHQNAKEEENAKEAITLFAKQEKEDIQKDPSSFVKPDNQA
jgi:hypothetical protein